MKIENLVKPPPSYLVEDSCQLRKTKGVCTRLFNLAVGHLLLKNKLPRVRSTKETDISIISVTSCHMASTTLLHATCYLADLSIDFHLTYPKKMRQKICTENTTPWSIVSVGLRLRLLHILPFLRRLRVTESSLSMCWKI